MRSPSLLILLPGLAAAAPTPAEQKQLTTRDAPSPPPRIVSVSYSGSGCPSASPAVDRTGGFDDIALRLNSFEARTSTTSAVEESAVNCQAHLSIAGAAEGWQVGVKDVFVRGHLVLDPGAGLDYYVTSFWSEDAGRTTTIKGTVANTGAAQLNQDVEARSTVPDGQVVYSPCTGTQGDVGLLNVNFRVALQAAGAQYGYFGKDPDTTASESWSYVWRRC
ncbi:uncharacterized protein F4807DRAFT_432539 [Annulohypoxylon truncatum]|uniref:uncharacterized protein n=1 Tax=Annulohypoxylon truncatum TaxID=327061 RepID=UPI002008B60C|nr:uncharacterized protein F4807DRAFT_432539 [Annulohypoxylon truncatum]KAI1207950.1 hypothetical protein F4807DRAFT_432539 [Annulohypoxylon truncatum]